MPASPLTLTHHDAVGQFVRDHRDAARDLLERTVAQNSYTTYIEGVNAVGAMMLDAMPGGFEHACVPDDRFGDHHILTRLREGKPRVVLAGHLDTLCPDDPNFNRVYEKGDRLLGPGVMDMKGGDVVLIFALRALEAAGLLDELSVTVIFNSDEEFGSPSSHPLFKAMEGKADFALVFEASGPTGTLVTTRRGVWRNRLHIEGVEHHFGCLKDRKVSALEEAAHKTLLIEALNDDPTGGGRLGANVGRIEGGLAANKVGHRATLDFETRCWDPDLHEAAIADLGARIVEPHVEGCRIELENLSYRPPMRLRDAHRWYYDIAAGVATALGQPMTEESRGGVSDACWLSHVGIPTLDGFGPLGDCDFTPDEYLITESLYDRIELTAHVLLQCAAHIGAGPSS